MMRRRERPRGCRRSGTRAKDHGHKFFTSALAAGATERKPVMNPCDGDRFGQLEDPFGHLWWVATHTEDVAPEEMQKRVQAMFAAKKSTCLGVDSAACRSTNL
jgi:hypothetical protein